MAKKIVDELRSLLNEAIKSYQRDLSEGASTEVDFAYEIKMLEALQETLPEWIVPVADLVGQRLRKEVPLGPSQSNGKEAQNERSWDEAFLVAQCKNGDPAPLMSHMERMEIVLRNMQTTAYSEGKVKLGRLSEYLAILVHITALWIGLDAKGGK